MFFCWVMSHFLRLPSTPGDHWRDPSPSRAFSWPGRTYRQCISWICLSCLRDGWKMIHGGSRCFCWRECWDFTRCCRMILGRCPIRCPSRCRCSLAQSLWGNMEEFGINNMGIKRGMYIVGLGKLGGWKWIEEMEEWGCVGEREGKWELLGLEFAEIEVLFEQTARIPYKTKSKLVHIL